MQEMDKIGPEDSPTWVNKYTAKQILDPEFRLPSSTSPEESGDILGSIPGMMYDEIK